MNTIGEMLRCERLKSGLELYRISQQTKIPARFLDAIEQEEFDKLPGRLFTISFVRQYAHALGLDEEQVIARLRAQQEPPVPIPPAPRRQPASAAALVMIAVGALVVLLASIAYEGWRNRRTHGAEVTRSAEGTADRLPVPERPRPQAALERAEAGSVSRSLRLVLRAQVPTWVGATVNGRSIFAGILRPNESKTLESATSVNLVIGNAGGLEISLNGKPIGPIGPSGQVYDVQVTSSDSVQIHPHRAPLQDLF